MLPRSSWKELFDEQTAANREAILRIEAEDVLEHLRRAREPQVFRQESNVAGVLLRTRRGALHRQERRRIGDRDAEMIEDAPRLQAGVLGHEALRRVVQPVLRQGQLPR